MREIIYSLPDQIERTLKMMESFDWHKFHRAVSDKKLERILICGMGGSGISGEIVSALYPEINLIVNKDYTIPDYNSRRTLAFLISYSGNTEETLTNYRILKTRRIPIIIIASDGELLEREAVAKIQIPGGLPPRGALGYLFTPIPVYLHQAGFLKNNPVNNLYHLSRFLKKERNNLEKRGRAIAKKLIGKLPVIYANSSAFLVAANRWRCQLNENSKVLCHTNIIPEMNHNEIVGLGRPKKLNKDLLIILLDDPNCHPRNRLRLKIVETIIKKEIEGTAIIKVFPLGKNRITQLFWTIMLGDFTSYFLAEITGVDPMPVRRIDYLKKILAHTD
ncbi:MAG: bifunctional phosphoglucose/phosphomannose isomerase [candidate division WOR-3 bacterium]